ncbi:MAG: protein kinase domain-containing protein [Chloroflexota bacterium]
MDVTRVGRYTTIKELGRGGMATVYLVRDPQDQRLYALKCLPSQFNHDPQFRDRFLRECRTVAQLHHPAIIPIYDFGEDERTPFLVMRYMPGGTLAERIARGPLASDEALRILKPVAAALDYAHQQGIVHRDVKPANIFFDEQGQPRLGDFGVVQLAEATRSFTGSAVIGTPAYMSPEQVKGGRKLDGRSDVYALAMVLYEMLSGRPPYAGETPTQQMMKHVLEPVPLIRQDNPQISPVLERILAKALAKDPAERYATASEFIQAAETLTPPAQPTMYGAPTRAYDGRTRLADAPPALPTAPARRPALVVGGLAAALACLALAGAAAAAGYYGLPRLGRSTPSLPPAAAASPAVQTVTPVQAAVLPDTGSAASPTPQPSVTPLPAIIETDLPSATPTTPPMPTAQPARPPQAQNDQAATDRDTPVQIPVTANDHDPDGNLDGGGLSIVQAPAHGQAQAGGGSVQYRPDPGFTGPDRFVYQVCDSTALCAQASVEIEVRAVNAPPQAQDDSYQAAQGQALQVPAPGVLGNDHDPDGGPLAARPVDDPQHGSLVLNPDGSFTYTAGSSCGSDRFTYQADDGQGGKDQAQAAIEIACPAAAAADVSITGLSPQNGTVLNAASQVHVEWRYTLQGYDRPYIFWQIKLLLYPDERCSGQGRDWGQVGYWARSPAAGGGSGSIDVAVKPSFMTFTPNGYPGYVAVQVLAIGQQGEAQTPGETLDEAQQACYPYQG